MARLSKNTLLRLAVFFVGLPLVAASAFVGRTVGLPIFASLVVGASALAAYEASQLFPETSRTYRGHAILIPLSGALVPLSSYILFRLGMAPENTFVVFVFLVTVAMGLQVARRTPAGIATILPSAVTHIFILVYPGLFTWHAMRLVELPHNTELVALFVLSVYMNDSMAWFFGRLFGRRTTNQRAAAPVAISPNKSIVGFVAGFLTSVVIVVGAGLVLPDVFSAPLGYRLILGAVIGVSSILGDLVESGLKRSAAVKDSGDVIPGRGGLLDSIDSPLFAAPFFYYGSVLLFST